MSCPRRVDLPSGLFAVGDFERKIADLRGIDLEGAYLRGASIRSAGLEVPMIR